jgi:hypothetical protein
MQRAEQRARLLRTATDLLAAEGVAREEFSSTAETVLLDLNYTISTTSSPLRCCVWRRTPQVYLSLHLLLALRREHARARPRPTRRCPTRAAQQSRCCRCRCRAAPPHRRCRVATWARRRRTPRQPPRLRPWWQQPNPWQRQTQLPAAAPARRCCCCWRRLRARRWRAARRVTMPPPRVAAGAAAASGAAALGVAALVAAAPAAAAAPGAAAAPAAAPPPPRTAAHAAAPDGAPTVLPLGSCAPPSSVELLALLLAAQAAPSWVSAAASAGTSSRGSSLTPTPTPTPTYEYCD